MQKLKQNIIIIVIIALFLVVGFTIPLPMDAYITALFILFSTHLVLDALDELC